MEETHSVPLELHCPSPRQAVEQIRVHLARNRRFKPVADDVLLAVIEAIGNVIEHTAAQYTVSVTANTKQVTIDVTDYGSGFSLEGHSMPAPFAEAGRGIPIMRSLVDSVEYTKGEASNRLRLSKNLVSRTHSRIPPP
jgi:anti-sigma regulatory factor (Ser/Thr protein kinase)